MTARAAFVALAFASVLFLPWQFVATLGALAVLWMPLVPLALGIFFDAVAYVPHAGLPYAAVAGAIASAAGAFIRSRLTERHRINN